MGPLSARSPGALACPEPWNRHRDDGSHRGLLDAIGAHDHPVGQESSLTARLADMHRERSPCARSLPRDTQASFSYSSPRPADDSLQVPPTSDASAQVDEAFRAARTVALQSNLRYIDPALGAPEDIGKADAQCADLQRNVADPDQVAALRFSTGDHKVTEADGKRINTLLRNTYCG